MCEKCKEYDKFIDEEFQVPVVPVLVKGKFKFLEIKYCAYCGAKLKGDPKEVA